MKEFACTEDRFLKDVERHAMTVIRDDGVNRHIRFKRPNEGAYWFDLITWPGALCIDGDMGTCVFRRLEDMFQFFRTDRDWLRECGTLAINPGYWGEKLQAVARNGGYRQFSKELVCESVKSRFDDWVESKEPTDDKKAALWQAIEDDVLYYSDDEPHEFMRAIQDFKHEDFEFTEFWETRTDEYTFHFIWCCYAIAWGVNTYDESKTIKEAA